MTGFPDNTPRRMNMEGTEAIRLTDIMRRDGILRIADNGMGFTVYLRGDVLGTGRTVGEAFDSALRQRAARVDGRIAA